MKTTLSTARRTISALLAVLILMIIFGAATATRAQVRAFADCVERERDVNGAFTGNYIAYFGYVNSGTATVNVPADTPNNFFSPVSATLDAPPSRFLPGVHRRVAALRVPIGTPETWFLINSFPTTDFSKLCGETGANSRLITYQGKLSDGAQAANGSYDLRFQLFNQPTGGEARTAQITLEDISVANGVFTVQLDLGAAALSASSNGGATPNLKLNPAILDAENSFFEIGVRAGTSTGLFTTLAPRQPLTAVPLAMRAESATTAFHAVNAEQLGGLSSNQFVQNTSAQQPNISFNISGNGTIGGNLTVGGTINGTATNATNVSGGFVQLPLTTSVPPASECNAASQYGRQKVDASNVRLYICTAAGWKFTELQ